MTKQILGETYHDLHEAAKALGISEATLQRRIKAGLITAYRDGGKGPILIADTVLRAYVENNSKATERSA